MEHKYYKAEDFATDASFIRYCFQEDEADVRYWVEWLENHPESKAPAEEAVQLVKMLSLEVPGEEKEADWQRLKKSLQLEHTEEELEAFIIRSRKSRKKSYFWWAAAAAVIIFIVGVFVKPGAFVNDVKPSEVAYQTGTGENIKVELPDQTRVWLNAESRLIWHDERDSPNYREVTIEGEGFFEVAKDAKQPLVIHANELNIEVLGTELNVNAYENTGKTTVTLISGVVRVYIKGHPENKVLLAPDEKFTFSENGKFSEINAADKKKLPPIAPIARKYRVATVKKDPLLDKGILETAWMQDKLAFRNVAFKTLALKLKHRFGIVFHFEDTSLANIRFTGIFTNENINEILHALQLTSPSDPFKYNIKGREVYIKNN